MSEGRGKTALVTGASSGIGKAFAELLAEKGYALVLTARRRDRLDELAATLRQRHAIEVHTIAADLAEPDASATIAAGLQQQGIAIDVLVNNAGYGVPGSYVNVPWPDHARFMQVMVTAVLDLTYRLLPSMVERGWGRVINIASVAGMVPSPAGHTLYGASKAFLIRFSEALASESMPKGVNVTAVCPGFTYSEFHDVTGTRDKMKRMPAWMWMDAPTVARQGFDAVMAGEHICINGRVNRTIAALCRLLPQQMVSSIGRRAGRTYRKS